MKDIWLRSAETWGLYNSGIRTEVTCGLNKLLIYLTNLAACDTGQCVIVHRTQRKYRSRNRSVVNGYGMMWSVFGIE